MPEAFLRHVRSGMLFILHCYTSVATGVAADSTTAEGAPRNTPTETVPDMPPAIQADGSALPPGQGDAIRGAAIHRQRCTDCHGSEGQGGTAVELVGDHAGLDGPWPDRGIAALWPVLPPLFDYVQRAMPPRAPGSLDDAATWDLLAHLLSLNGLHDPTEPLDSAALQAIRMPNRDGFGNVDAPSVRMPSPPER